MNREDGLQLRNTYIAAAVRCAPPANKPLPGEIQNCRVYLERELAILKPTIILALGKIAWDAPLDLLRADGKIASRAAYKFGHGAECIMPGRERLVGVYHPSQRNTPNGTTYARDVCECVEKDSKVFGLNWAQGGRFGKEGGMTFGFAQGKKPRLRGFGGGSDCSGAGPEFDG